MFMSVGLRCREELTEQFENKQHPDIAIYDFKDGKKLLLDVAITHPLAKRLAHLSSTQPGFAAAEKEKEKDHKYLAKASSLGYLFRPLALEVYSRWGNRVEETLEEISKQLQSGTGINPSQFKLQWRRRIGICLQKANADIIRKKISSIVGRGNLDTVDTISYRYFGFDFAN